MFTRTKSFKQGVVEAPIGDVWALLMDFAGHAKWWPTVEEGGRPGPAMVRVDLIGGMTQVPRTRRVLLETGAVVDETLLYANEETHRLYYDMVPHVGADGQAFRGAIVGYLCCTTLDAVDAGHTRMTFEASFDVRALADPDEARLGIEAVHECAILNGYRRYFARQRTAAAH